MKPASRATPAGFRWAVCAPGHLLVTPRQGKVRVQSVPGVVGIAAHESMTVDHGARATATVDHGARATAWVDGPVVRGSPRQPAAARGHSALSRSAPPTLSGKPR